MRIVIAFAVSVLAMTAGAQAQDRSQFTCSQSAQACVRNYPQWATTKCAQAEAQCKKSPLGNGFCQFNAPDGSGSGARRCG
jgi:hypothetical protein